MNAAPNFAGLRRVVAVRLAATAREGIKMARKRTVRGTNHHRRHERVGFLCCAVAALLLGGSTGAQGGPSASQERLDRVASLMRVVEDLRASIDRAAFDVTELSFQLAFEEPEAIGAWVRDEIAFEQYAGILRGGTGTLVSGAGNAWDQALLLATLLRNVGYDARIVRGTLSDLQAQALVAQMAAPRRPERPGVAEDVARAAIRELGAVAELSAPQIDELTASVLAPEPLDATASFAMAARDQHGILQLLAEAGVGSDGTSPWRAVVEEARDYAWVEYRLGSSDEWRAYHPALRSPEGFEDLAASERFDESIPPELQHRVRVEAFVERRTGADTDAVAIMDPWERPAANLFGTPITYTNMADGLVAFGVDEDEGIDDAVARTRMFFPWLGDSFAPGAQAFDLLGNTAPADAASSPMAGVFLSVSGAASRATSALSALGSATAGDVGIGLDRQYLRVTLIAPGGAESSYERTVGERGGGDVETVLALGRLVTISIIVGRYNAPYALDRFLAKVLSLRPLIETRLAQEPGADVERLFPNADLQGGDATWIGDLALVPAMDALETHVRSSTVLYRPTPTIVLSYMPNPLATTGTEAVDVLTNTRRALGVAEDGLRWDFDAMVLAGVWETHVEGIALSGPVEGRVNTVTVLQEAVARGDELVVVRHRDELDRLSAAGLSAVARANLERDLERGFVAIVPRGTTAEGGETAWWRVHPGTGETLGILGNGYGGELLKNIILRGAVAGGVAAGLCMVFAEQAEREGFIANSGTKVYSCLGFGAGTAGLVVPAAAAGWLYGLGVVLLSLDVFEVGL